MIILLLELALMSLQSIHKLTSPDRWATLCRSTCFLFPCGWGGWSHWDRQKKDKPADKTPCMIPWKLTWNVGYTIPNIPNTVIGFYAITFVNQKGAVITQCFSTLQHEVNKATGASTLLGLFCYSIWHVCVNVCVILTNCRPW